MHSHKGAVPVLIQSVRPGGLDINGTHLVIQDPRRFIIRTRLARHTNSLYVSGLMNIDIKDQKTSLREQAKRTRCMLANLDAKQQKELCSNFFENIEIQPDSCVASYWPIGRELDTSILMEELVSKNIKVALPIVEKGSRVLKFALWDVNAPMSIGPYNIPHPEIDDKTVWLEPDVVLVPCLAFDRRGYRLGYGGGYYDSTLAEYRSKKEIVAIGLAYAEQACLFHLPVEEHDQKMDWIITEQNIMHVR